MKITDLVQHKIAASNILIGASTFLTLALPKTWNISMGAGSPEITASHQHDGKRWVATGNAWYILHVPSQRWAMELRLTAKPGRSRRAISATEFTVADHPASITWQTRRRGFIKRWSVTYVTVEFYCPYTERQLRLEFSGSPPDEAFEEAIEAVQYVCCH